MNIKMKEICNQPHYADNYSELIHLFISVSYKSIFAYVMSALIYTWFLYTFIPGPVLFTWAFIQFSYPIVRLSLAAYYKGTVFTEKSCNRFINLHIVIAAIAGVTWGMGSVLCAVYAPSPYEYMVLILIVGLSSGSLSTLSSIYRVYLAFNLPALILLLGAFLLYDDSVHYAIAFMIVIYLFIVPSATWDVNKSFKCAVELNRLYAKSQKELENINASLEEKISNAVAENRKKDKQILAQSRLAQMGEMLSMIAHQWRQPLSAIVATTSSMTLQMQLDGLKRELIEESLEKINTYTYHLSTTISDFRDFFRPDREKSETSLNEIVNGSLSIIGPSLDVQGIVLESSLESPQKFMSYPNELKQVILNILKNAQDVIDEKGVSEGKIEIKAETIQDHYQLSICDNAGGIDQENISRVFDPYFTTKEEVDGTGLGLYMSKMIVEDHCNGSLEVCNKNGGACFVLKIPWNSD